jgi:hypothetical protein
MMAGMRPTPAPLHRAKLRVMPGILQRGTTLPDSLSRIASFGMREEACRFVFRNGRGAILLHFQHAARTIVSHSRKDHPKCIAARIRRSGAEDSSVRLFPQSPADPAGSTPE